MEMQELILADQYAIQDSIKNNGLVRTNQSAENLTGDQNGSEDLTLPAALCDEQLLAEIQSIPNKLGFKIGDVADLLEIKQYVLRYWETEFEILKPKKASNNQRYYTKKDVENAMIIRKLLYRDRFSIEGARAALRDVKQFVKKEKKRGIPQAKFEKIQDRIDDLLIEIQKAKALFIK